MTACIIHDPHRTDRHLNLARELSEQAIEFTFFPAIYHNVPCTGIVRAHKSVIQFAKDKGLPTVAILEDDVKFTAPGAWQYFLKNIPTDFDIYAGGISVGKPDKQNIVTRWAGAFCYIVHSRYYGKFLAFDETLNVATNISHTKGIYVVCNPMVAKTYDGYSDHRKKEVIHNHYFDKYVYLS